MEFLAVCNVDIKELMASKSAGREVSVVLRVKRKREEEPIDALREFGAVLVPLW